MSETEYTPQRSASGAFFALVVVAFLAALGGLIWSYNLSSRITATETKLVTANKENADLKEKLDATNAHLRAATETLGASVGITQKQLELKSQAILSAQKAADEKLLAAQAASDKQIAAVKTDVTAVRTDVGGVKTEVATTKTDLEATKSQLQRVVGDAGVMSGEIATNSKELEILKHRGDRNYIEFDIHKGEKPLLLSTIKVQLKKVDTKRGKYTLEVSSDDRTIEKKDKNLDEPVQFYSGKDPALFEIVVNNMDKNRVSGYLSTPKSGTVKNN